MRKKYEAEDKRLIQVVFNTVSMNQKIKSIVIENSSKVGAIFDQISKGNSLNPKKYELYMLPDDK